MSMSVRRAWSFYLRALAFVTIAVIWTLPVSAEPSFVERARAMFPQADYIGAITGSPPVAEIGRAGRLIGYALLTDQVAPIPAYSGKPIRVLVGIDTSGVIRGAEILAHEARNPSSSSASPTRRWRISPHSTPARA